MSSFFKYIYIEQLDVLAEYEEKNSMLASREGFNLLLQAIPLLPGLYASILRKDCSNPLPTLPKS